jgi:hypothetical protein
MGMDISGINPVRRGEEPKIDWENSTKEEQEKYWELREQYNAENPGVYFRANLWSWRPIAELITTVNQNYGLGYDDDFIGKLHYNDGGGLKTQEECNRLADFLESYVKSNFDGWKRIGVYYGQLTYTTVNEEGHLIEKWMDEKDSLEKILLDHSTEALICDVLYVRDGEVTHDGVVYHTTHSTSMDHIQEFIDFLRECGGFEIW